MPVQSKQKISKQAFVAKLSHVKSLSRSKRMLSHSNSVSVFGSGVELVALGLKIDYLNVVANNVVEVYAQKDVQKRVRSH